jgi:hypothetical protein
MFVVGEEELEEFEEFSDGGASCRVLYVMRTLGVSAFWV